MAVYYAVDSGGSFVEHHGVIGMKWGVRRFQNKNGTLTPEGIKRYRQTRRDIWREAGKIGALEQNLRNKADIAAPAHNRIAPAQQAYERALQDNSRRRLFEGRAGRERRAEAIRKAEYALNEAKQTAAKSKALYNKASILYEKQVQKVNKMIESAIEEYGDSAVNKLEFSDSKLGITVGHNGADVAQFEKRLVSNLGHNPFKVRMADIADTVLEAEREYAQSNQNRR